MDGGSRSERVERRLALRLEELAGALERAGAPADAVARLLELASVATMHAIALELLSQDRADRIWASAIRRHPALRRVEGVQILSEAA